MIDEDDLKCCGNCSNRDAVDMGDYMSETCRNKKITQSCEICREWEYDKMIFHRRII
jgi:hypothetical protein